MMTQLTTRRLARLREEQSEIYLTDMSLTRSDAHRTAKGSQCKPTHRTTA